MAEEQGFIKFILQKHLLKGCRASLTAIEQDRKAIDKAIDPLIESADQRQELFGLITAIPGSGSATATEVVIAANELKAITDPKKMACQAGVAPFNYPSGSSVGGRPRQLPV